MRLSSPSNSPERCDTPPGAHKGAGNQVSIHAPARGATVLVEYHLFDIPVSIHAPARGATRALPRPERRHPVSIHTPARSTTAIPLFLAAFERFQTTRRRRARYYLVIAQNDTRCYRNTFPNGAQLDTTYNRCSDADVQNPAPERITTADNLKTALDLLTIAH